MTLKRYFWLTVLCCSCFCFAAAQSPTTPTSAASSEEHRKTSDPYTGDLSIFDSAGRDERLQINRVMDILGITSGKGVADIGAGSGWFTVRAAKHVGGSGRVYAVDINPEAMRYVEERAKKEQLDNVKTILSHPDDPLLPKDSVDAVLLLKTYHEVAEPVTLLRNLRGALRAGAKEFSVPMALKPAFCKTLSDPALSLAARACSGRAGTRSRSSDRARLAMPRPQAARSIQ